MTIRNRILKRALALARWCEHRRRAISHYEIELLAEHFEVHPRTIYRDFSELREAGFPVPRARYNGRRSTGTAKTDERIERARSLRRSA